MGRVPQSEAISETADARRFNEFKGGNGFRQQEYRRLARLECSRLPHWHIVDEFMDLTVVVGA